MELEFESRAVQWYGCLVHRADTELGGEGERERERERERAPTAIHSVANYSAPPLPLLWPAAVLFCSATVAMAAAICRTRRLLLSPPHLLG